MGPKTKCWQGRSKLQFHNFLLVLFLLCIDPAVTFPCAQRYNLKYIFFRYYINLQVTIQVIKLCMVKQLKFTTYLCYWTVFWKIKYNKQIGHIFCIFYMNVATIIPFNPFACFKFIPVDFVGTLEQSFFIIIKTTKVNFDITDIVT